VDATEGGVDLCCGDNGRCEPGTDGASVPPDPTGPVRKRPRLPCPPEQLPAVLLLIRRPSMREPEVRYLTRLGAQPILTAWRTGTADAVSENATEEVDQILRSFGLEGTGRGSGPRRTFRQPLRIFVGGDRMSVGKTSVCLGLLGTLVARGYPPGRLGYIKPATQNEEPQLVQRYCERMGIPCVPVGPVVYYRGFTRAFLAGETDTTDELLAKVEDAVDLLARDKDVVIVDGVGFPAVGSICGTDNASVALASGYPDTYSYGQMSRKAPGVLLVGGPGVGSAVDAFNLNATYFECGNVPVLGAVFNKLSPEGFYSLENCKKEISEYFAQVGRRHHGRMHGRKAFGFVPVFPKLGGADAFDHVHDFIRIFGDHFDMDALLEDAYAIQQRRPDGRTGGDGRSLVTIEPPAAKKQRRAAPDDRPVRTREEIESLAIGAGAAPSA
jgi:hypothetical protein